MGVKWLRQELHSSAFGGILVTDAFKGVRTEVLTQHEISEKVTIPHQWTQILHFESSEKTIFAGLGAPPTRDSPIFRSSENFVDS